MTLDPRDADPLTVEPDDPRLTGTARMRKATAETEQAFAELDSRLLRLRNQRRQRRWGCLLVVALTALCWLSLYVVVHVVVAAPPSGPGSPFSAPSPAGAGLSAGSSTGSGSGVPAHSGAPLGAGRPLAGRVAATPGGGGPIFPAPQPAGTFPPALSGGATTDVLWTGIVNYSTPSFGRWYLAIPAGPGVRVRICGPGGCLDRTSTDAGPSLERQRAGRIADLNWIDWQAISGVPLRYGGFPGSVLVLKRPAISLPQTDRSE